MPEDSELRAEYGKLIIEARNPSLTDPELFRMQRIVTEALLEDGNMPFQVRTADGGVMTFNKLDELEEYMYGKSNTRV